MSGQTEKNKKTPHKRKMRREGVPTKDCLPSKKAKSLLDIVSSHVLKITKEMCEMRRGNEKILKLLNSHLERGTFLLQQSRDKIEGFEETMVYLVHNIKKNQFLYAHYPDEWVKDYLDLKKGMKHENEFMDKKSLKRSVGRKE